VRQHCEAATVEYRGGFHIKYTGAIGGTQVGCELLIGRYTTVMACCDKPGIMNTRRLPLFSVVLVKLKGKVIPVL
jgi:hypothetical protein